MLNEQRIVQMAIVRSLEGVKFRISSQISTFGRSCGSVMKYPRPFLASPGDVNPRKWPSEIGSKYLWSEVGRTKPKVREIYERDVSRNSTVYEG